MRLFSNTKVDFVSKRYIFYAVSIALVSIGMFNLYSKGNNAYGIDFAGGQLQEYRFEKPVKTEALRESLKEVGLGDIVIQQFEKNPEDVIIRSSNDTYDKVVGVFREKIPDNNS